MTNKLAMEIIRQNQRVLRELQKRKAQAARESREIERMMRDNRMQGV